MKHSPFVFIDIVGNRFPKGSGDPIFPARIAINSPATAEPLIFLVKPDGWIVGEEVQPYIRATPEDMAGAWSLETAMRTMTESGLFTPESILVAHNMPYHFRLFQGLTGDASRLLERRCTMSQSGPMMKLRLESNGKWRSPKLADAYRYFTGEEPEDPPDWHSFAANQLHMVARVWDGIRRENSR